MKKFQDVVIGDANGLHTRPAAKLAKKASEFKSDITLFYRDGSANAKNLKDIVDLRVQGNATVALSAEGPDSEQALTDLRDLLKEA
ncbi:hypothetical protein A6E01_19965 (plasmid) [Vibrio breoganii]|uniref:Phosphocarrier protein HPr n=1 Tax=Vibrio breoganii TaxID=553239 RepID=A0AAN0XZM9_9VIBR|nr:HPr family phosphocarrier protein [Vibrio breoganii]ANO35491.1 hypothetical protein A6E01_19965 [Vibrio breoganii]